MAQHRQRSCASSPPSGQSISQPRWGTRPSWPANECSRSRRELRLKFKVDENLPELVREALTELAASHAQQVHHGGAVASTWSRHPRDRVAGDGAGCLSVSSRSAASRAMTIWMPWTLPTGKRSRLSPEAMRSAWPASAAAITWSSSGSVVTAYGMAVGAATTASRCRSSAMPAGASQGCLCEPAGELASREDGVQLVEQPLARAQLELAALGCNRERGSYTCSLPGQNTATTAPPPWPARCTCRVVGGLDYEPPLVSCRQLAHLRRH